MLEVFALFGGIEIRVPESWTVVDQVTPILGGYEDKARSPAAEPGKRLVVKGVAVFGGVEVRN